MDKWLLSFAGLVLASLPVSASAESLRCSNGIVAEGDSRLAVVYKCGQPVLRDGYCAPVYYNGSAYPLQPGVANAYVPCIYTEEWLYERGPGAFPATVRIQNSKVLSIAYGRP